MQYRTRTKWLQYIAACCSTGLFAIFFLVQCLRNFDVGDTTVLPAQVLSVSQHHIISASHPTPETKVHIRLNKRFQSTSVNFASKWPKPPVISYLEIVRLYNFYDSNLLSTIRLHTSLRGPPAQDC
ncbi:hypothetical protein GA0116948_105265 [Chitinophaga costaii]|uniref:Uncharacterized protein n=1 Tax=Chitinophaga costaii TaxID=1335309 RepID=A0A1C4DGP1_9BACT|nr:hypothetical protein [Chitinophaga costaii]PUZ24626.1 hypothetical protein DCM91_12090 [Chitinophaga costaii]SCC30532.1 hypothetical protein GA0116948_105265 [Chitinophaga costaii]